MSTALDIHPANDAERLQAYRSVHEFWGRGLPMDEHLRHRLASVQHNRATWFVGCLDGQVVTSLGCYPMHFQVRGKIVPGISIAAVHTRPEFRGRGFAPQMFDWVEAFQQEAGMQISLLYSDIAPAYYARLGYVECPAFEAWIDLATTNLDETPIPVRLLRFASEVHSEFDRDCYARCHEPRPISIHRTADYWNFLGDRDREDILLRIVCEANGLVGYVHVGMSREAREDEPDPLSVWKIRDLAISDEQLPDVLTALIATARENGIDRIGGWLPDSTWLRSLTDVAPREDEITMLKSLSPEIKLDAEMIASAVHFQEVDHV